MRDKPLFITSLIFFGIFVLFAATIFSPLRKVFSPFITTAALVYFLSPCITWAKRLGIRPLFATLIVYALIVGMVFFLILVAMPVIKDAIDKIIKLGEEYIDVKIFDIIPENVFSSSAKDLYDTLVSVVKITLEILVGATASFYILADENNRETTMKLIPNELKKSFRILEDDVKGALDSFFKGQMLIAAILFVMMSSFLCFIGIDYAWGLGAIAALFDIVPYIGAITATGIIMLVTIATAPQKAFAVILGILVIQQIENNIITPKISSDTLSVHPSVTVLVLYLGSFGGFWGILLSIPMFCVLKKICFRLIQSIL